MFVVFVMCGFVVGRGGEGDIVGNEGRLVCYSF